MAILILHIIDFQSKLVARDKEGHEIGIKESIHHEAITILDIYAPYMGAPKYLKQIITELKGETAI